MTNIIINDRTFENEFTFDNAFYYAKYDKNNNLFFKKSEKIGTTTRTVSIKVDEFIAKYDEFIANKSEPKTDNENEPKDEPKTDNKSKERKTPTADAFFAKMPSDTYIVKRNNKGHIRIFKTDDSKTAYAKLVAKKEGVNVCPSKELREARPDVAWVYHEGWACKYAYKAADWDEVATILNLKTEA